MPLDVPYYRQHRDYTCGPACLRMVLAYYGHEADEVSLTMLCGTNVLGTGLSDLATAAQQLGFRAEHTYCESLAELTEAVARGIPPIAMVDAAKLYNMGEVVPIGHVVVVIAASESEIVYHDPLVTTHPCSGWICNPAVGPPDCKSGGSRKDPFGSPNPQMLSIVTCAGGAAGSYIH